ncbi:MAG: GTP cyclohydrolase I FolE [Chitinophagales bacterium]|nr:GTP cyclohydrolase I FolE [Chitinophagales bacterium]
MLYKREDNFNEDSVSRMTELYKEILELTGEDAKREGLVKTPLRVARAMHFMTQGYEIDAGEILRSAIFEEAHSEMVIVKDIELYSMCEHHMLPFYGRAHVAYIPDRYITGLSKIARVVDVFARRLQVQERLTCQIRDVIQKTLNPLGVAVVVEAKHLCMMMRGVEKQNSVTTTSAFTGEFENNSTRSEFISLISSKLS